MATIEWSRAVYSPRVVCKAVFLRLTQFQNEAFAKSNTVSTATAASVIVCVGNGRYSIVYY